MKSTIGSRNFDPRQWEMRRFFNMRKRIRESSVLTLRGTTLIGLQLLAIALLPSTLRPALARAQFKPDTLWVAAATAEIYQITLSRDRQGVPQSSGVSLFASTGLWGLSPGLAFFDGELYYASSREGTICRYQANGDRVAYATGFSPNSYGLTSLLFDEVGDLLAAETTNTFKGAVWSIPVGGGSAPFSALLSSAEVATPISLLRDPRTEDLYVNDWLAGKVIALDTTGGIRTVAQGLFQPAGLQVDCDGNLYVSEHKAHRVTKIFPSGGSSTLFGARSPEGIAVDAFGFFYVALNNGDIVRFEASGNPVVLANIGTDADQVLWFGGGSGPNTGIPICARDVEIDIKPGSFPNSINPRSQGVIPVAILTTDTFDATTVDPSTVLFGKTAPEAAPVHQALEDVDGDGDTDLILHFNTQATGIQCGDTSASLTGGTLSGQMIQGSNSVKTAGCK